MDVSAGLAGGLTKLCRVSGVAAKIDVASVPLSEAARAVVAIDMAMRETALTGGDDFEVLCTVPEARTVAFRAAAQRAQVPVTDIGVVEAGEGARFMDGTRELAFKRLSFSHFCPGGRWLVCPRRPGLLSPPSRTLVTGYAMHDMTAKKDAITA